MKRVALRIIAALTAVVVVPISSANAHTTWGECAQEAQDKFDDTIARCGNGSLYHIDLCHYAAGLERDSEINICNNSYPQGVSDFLPINQSENMRVTTTLNPAHQEIKV